MIPVHICEARELRGWHRADTRADLEHQILLSHRLRFGGPTGSAQPLLWAHSEYIKLHRSASEGKVVDVIEPVYDRYVRGVGERSSVEVWKFNRQIRTAVAGALLRIQADSPFLLHWTDDEWQHSADTRANATAIGVQFVDIPLRLQQKAPVRFTFFGSRRAAGKAKTTSSK